MLTCIGSKILIKRMDEDKLESSIISVVHLDESKESQYAVVISAGTGLREDIKVGDTVITKKYCGTPVELRPREGAPREKFYVIMEGDVLGVLRV